MTTIAQEEVLRRMRLAQALREQANSPIQADPRGAVSWTQGLAKILQGIGAARQERRAMEDAKALQAQRQQALAAALRLPPEQQPTALMGIEGYEDTGAKLMIESARNRQLAEMLSAAAKSNPDLDPNQLATRATLGGPDAAFGYIDRMTATPAQERDYRLKLEERDYNRARDAKQDVIEQARLADEGISLPAKGAMTYAQVDELITRNFPDITPEERALAHATIQEESAYRPDADSGKASGIAQFTPETGARYGLRKDNFNDPEAQIKAMVNYQRDIAKKTGFSPYAIATGYHAGEGGLETGEGVGPKTVGYAARVQKAYKERLAEIKAMEAAGEISPKQARDQKASAKADAAAIVKDEMAHEISPIERERLNIEKERLEMDKKAAEEKKRNPNGLTPTQMGIVRQKQATIENVLIPQLQALKEAIFARKPDGSFDETQLSPELKRATGIVQGLIPEGFTEKGGPFEAAVDNIRSSITAMRRVPGVGAQSDYETKLDQAPLPDRRDSPQKILAKIRNLENTIIGYKTLNDSLVGDVGTTSVPAGWSIEVEQ